MIDRIRQDIQERLDQLLAEAEKLRQALSALGGERSQAPARSSRGSDSESPARSRTRASSSSRARGSSSSPSSTPRSRGRTSAPARSRASAGGTKNAVLKALGDAGGEAMTASEVAAATGLGRASVSTTLSKLARAGDVTKASRGYRLADGGSAANDGGGAAEAVASESGAES